MYRNNFRPRLINWTLHKSIKYPITQEFINTLGWVGLSPIKPAQWFLGRSGQNELMRSNDFCVILSNTVRGLYLREANNCENKASIWIYLKNSFAWLTGMKKLIFNYNNFFGLGHFLTHDILKNRPKNDRNQKVIGSKN